MEQSRRDWSELLEGVEAKMRQWRAAHPRATFTEIEGAVDAELARVRARLLEELVHESPNTEWRGQAKADRPKCPVCGAALNANGKAERTLVTEHEQVIKLRRSHGRCPVCKATVFPPG